MKLYEINNEIEDILRALEPDEDTGEVPANEEELLDRLESLEMDRDEVLRYIAKMAINSRAEVSTLTAEIDRLRRKKDRAESKAERLIAILDRECNGKKTDLGVATLSYRKSSAVFIDDDETVIKWLSDTGNEDAYKTSTVVNKAMLKRAMNGAETVPGAHIETRTSASLR